jgi:alkylation response protein AidB-like acyl-CoA dehydrogenase
MGSLRMDFDLSDDQKMLREQARRFLGSAVTYDGLRAHIAEGAGIDRRLWKQVADMGWLAVTIPEACGGLGLGTLDQGVIAEELGRRAAPVPYAESAGLAVDIVLRLGSEAQKAELLPRLAAGDMIAGLAFFEGGGAPDEAAMATFRTTASGGRIAGVKSPVIDADAVDLLLVAAKDEQGRIAVFLVERGAIGIASRPLHGFDQLRLGSVLTFADTPCTRLGDGGDAGAALIAAFDRAAIVCAFEQLGGAQECMEMARDYAIERRAFGRQIGSYQAIKHRLADMLVKIELARSNAYFAGWAADHDPGAAPLAAAAARLTASEAYDFAARENTQVHGGISFTWEANCHFHYRRSRLLATWLGGERHWSRRTIAGLLAARAAA